MIRLGERVRGKHKGQSSRTNSGPQGLAPLLAERLCDTPGESRFFEIEAADSARKEEGPEQQKNAGGRNVFHPVCDSHKSSQTQG
jgi:hypothetical protein